MAALPRTKARLANPTNKPLVASPSALRPCRDADPPSPHPPTGGRRERRDQGLRNTLVPSTKAGLAWEGSTLALATRPSSRVAMTRAGTCQGVARASVRVRAVVDA